MNFNGYPDLQAGTDALVLYSPDRTSNFFWDGELMSMAGSEEI